MTFRISIRKPHIEMLMALAAVSPTQEICGLISGYFDWRMHHGTVGSVIPITNIATRPEVAFHLHPEEQVAAMFDFEAAGQELVAIFHSHPQGPARPSETDIMSHVYREAFVLILFPRTSLRTVNTAMFLGEEWAIGVWHIEKGKVSTVQIEVLS